MLHQPREAAVSRAPSPGLRVRCPTMGDGRPDDNQSPPRRRVTVQEAAEILGVTVEAVRGRVKRGTMETERTPEGVFAWLVESDEATGRDQTSAEERRRNDTIIAQLSQANAAFARRVPEIEPPQAPDVAEPVSEGTDRGDVPQEQQEPVGLHSSWWRRFFGFE